MSRQPSGNLINATVLKETGLTPAIFKNAIAGTYDLLDKVDLTLTGAGGFPLSLTVELANLSSMIGNIFGAALARHSNGLYRRNGPHKYPDLLSNQPNVHPNIEIKMALENNKPKGHLAKEGYYITCRYVLCEADGSFIFDKTKRGITPYLWEIRGGHLKERHFNVSNTAGDSGKTAVVNAEGMEFLKVVYIDLARAPISKKGRVFAEYQSLIQAD